MDHLDSALGERLPINSATVLVPQHVDLKESNGAPCDAVSVCRSVCGCWRSRVCHVGAIQLGDETRSDNQFELVESAVCLVDVVLHEGIEQITGQDDSIRCWERGGAVSFEARLGSSSEMARPRGHYKYCPHNQQDCNAGGRHHADPVKIALVYRDLHSY